MPKLLTRPPKYARHKASGQAVVKIGKKLRYLGPWNSADSKIRYKAVVAEWSAAHNCAPAAAVPETLPESDTTVTELLEAAQVVLGHRQHAGQTARHAAPDGV